MTKKDTEKTSSDTDRQAQVLLRKMPRTMRDAVEAMERATRFRRFQGYQKKTVVYREIVD